MKVRIVLIAAVVAVSLASLEGCYTQPDPTRGVMGVSGTGSQPALPEAGAGSATSQTTTGDGSGTGNGANFPGVQPVGRS